MDGRKIYEFTVTWGEERSTDDLEGEVTQSSTSADRSRHQGTASELHWNDQPDPATVLCDQDCRRARYDLARDGETVEIPSREVDVHRLTLLKCETDRAFFEVECGKGTYVRSLARDFGRDLGCYGHISKLRRSYVAPFAKRPWCRWPTWWRLKQSRTRTSAWRRWMPSWSTRQKRFPPSPAQDHRRSGASAAIGNPIIVRGRDAPVAEPEAVALSGSKLVAIGEIAGGEFHPRRVFN